MKRNLVITAVLLISHLLYAQTSNLMGSGTFSDPYTISSSSELKYLAEQINNKNTKYTLADTHFILTQDIDLSKETLSWVSIGNSISNEFIGIFEGNNKKISGIKIGSSTAPSSQLITGLFGICNGATISNLTLESVSIFTLGNSGTESSVGALAASITNGTIIHNCQISGQITSSYPWGTFNVGGIVGKMELGSIIKNSSTNVTINATSKLTGSITTATMGVGGIVGVADGTATLRPEINNCYSLGAIRAEGTLHTVVAIGGITGRNCPNINNCYSKCDVTGVATTGPVKVGGITGQRGGVITNCIALNSVLTAIGSGSRTLGRIADAAQTSTSIAYCYASSSLMMKQAASVADPLQNFTQAAIDVALDKKGGLDLGSSNPLDILNNFVATPGCVNKYILLNQTTFTDSEAKLISDNYGAQNNKRYAVGLGVIISLLQAHPTTVLNKLQSQLDLSLKYNLPILIKLDVEVYWDYRKDLWNWWDATDKATYNPLNKENVEWTDWSSTSAVKLTWLDWGRQLRKAPCPNLMSPTYIAVSHTEITKSVNLIKKWYDALSSDKKYLFAGIVVGWESSIGVTNYYYPNGNDLLNADPANDPQTGRTIATLPSRGVQTIGYAAVKTASNPSIATSGTLTAEMQTEVVRRHLESMSKTVFEQGIPRTCIYTHCGGWANGESLYKAAVNEYSCPGWSFYSKASNPETDVTAMSALTKSTAPYWGAVEWLYSRNKNKLQSEWLSAFKASLIKNTRMVCIYNNDILDTIPNATAAIKEMNAFGTGFTTTPLLKWLAPTIANPALTLDRSSVISSTSTSTLNTRLKVYSKKNVIVIEGVEIGVPILIYNLEGKLVWKGKAEASIQEISLPKGMYLFDGQKICN